MSREYATLDGDRTGVRPVVLEMPSFRAWLARQPRETQHKHLKAMRRAGSATVRQLAREYRRLWGD